MFSVTESLDEMSAVNGAQPAMSHRWSHFIIRIEKLPWFGLYGGGGRLFLLVTRKGGANPNTGGA